MVEVKIETMDKFGLCLPKKKKKLWTNSATSLEKRFEKIMLIMILRIQCSKISAATLLEYYIGYSDES